MGTQSITYLPRRRHALLRIVGLLLLFFLASHLSVPAQTPSASALTVPLIFPSAIAFDSAGNLYIAETANHLIRKVDTTSSITTVAGNGMQGLSGDTGPAISASLDSPQGLAVDSANNLYIADTHNHRIRKLDLTTGIITTVAGTTPGFSGDNNLATSAKLNLPTALAFDATGDLYLADTGNHRIRKIASSGVITTVAGTGTQGFSGDNGPATSAAIDSPTGLALDSIGNLYLADTHNHRIRRIDTSTGLITTIAGTGTPGFSGDATAATAAALALPHGLTLDLNGILYFADTENHRIRRIDIATGLITTVAGDGTQAFSGDNGPATAASLNTPRATALSPATLLTFADTGNQRVRQLTAASTPATPVQTIAGLGLSTPGTLAITAPSVIAYGTGQLIASFTSNTFASGSITFFDNTRVTATLGTAAVLISNIATFPTAVMPVGLHTVTATYSGDQTHGAAQSPAVLLTITPQQLIATVNPITLLYGQPVPAISGTLTGVLPQDASNLSAIFTTTAVALSPVGTYPITVSLIGPAAGNYTIASTPQTITITPAPTLVTLQSPTVNGSSINLAAHVASTTTGIPTGSVTLYDSGSPVFTSTLSAGGDTLFTVTSATQGPHSYTAFYSGSPNLNSSPSAPQLITVGAGPTTNPDFALAPTGATTQTISSGSSAAFAFAVQLQGALSSPITLAAAGLPNLATASFNPPVLPPGSPTNTFTLTIATPGATARAYPYNPITWTLLLCPITVLALRRPRKATKLVPIALFSLALLLSTGCGDRINTADSLTLAAKSYTITVTGTATTSTGSILQHSATVTLMVAPPL